MFARRAATATALVAGALLLGGCAEVGAATSPTPTGSPGVDVLDLEVGDCLAPGGASKTAPTVPLVDCELEHDGEAYASIMLTDTMFPGADRVKERAIEECTARFTEFVGLAYEESALDFAYYYPTATSWERGDHEILCLVIDPAADSVSGSLEGAKR